MVDSRGGNRAGVKRRGVKAGICRIELQRGPQNDFKSECISTRGGTMEVFCQRYGTATEDEVEHAAEGALEL